MLLGCCRRSPSGLAAAERGFLGLSVARRHRSAQIDASQEPVSGTVRLKLYKAPVSVLGRRSPESLCDEDVVTFEDDRGAYGCG